VSSGSRTDDATGPADASDPVYSKPHGFPSPKFSNRSYSQIP
jgi:hypothetical protein